MSSGAKIFPDAGQLKKEISESSQPLVFTNGLFDILHRGHVAYLEESRELGSSLLVALNTDESARRQGKGDDRPLNPLEDRMAVVAALQCVDFVTCFDDDTPLSLIEFIQPQVLVKGGDWGVKDIVGRDVVEQLGGKVYSIPFRYQRSTSSLVDRIRRS